MDCGRRQPIRAEGQGQGSGRCGGPTGAGPLLKAVRSPEDPRRRTSQENEGCHGGVGGGILTCCLCGRQEKVCLTYANSGRGWWASRGERGTRCCRVPSEAVELGAREMAAHLYFNIIFLPGEIWVDFSFVASLARVSNFTLCV